MLLQEHGIQCSVVHGTMDQEARKEAMAAFYHRRTFVLVVTDVAARGLDIPLLDYVINVSFPSTEKLFIHRVGRVARAGRSGTAYSFVGHEEIPFLLDVHLGLQRTLRNEKAEGDTPKTVNYYGTMAEEVTRRHTEILGRALAANPELKQLEKTANNGYKQYRRTRNQPSRSSNMQSKAFLEATRVHPEIAETLTDLSTRRATVVKELSKYRGGGTIFQVQDGRQSEAHKDKFEESRKFIAHAQKVQERKRASEMLQEEEGGHTPQAVVRPLSLGESLVQKCKRRMHDGTMHAPTEIPNADKEYFIPYVPERSNDPEAEGSQILRDATLDVNADTLEGIQSKRSVYMWNKKTNKYTKQNVVQAKLLMRGLKNEAGSKVNMRSDQRTYKKWSEKTKLRIQDVGEDEDGRAERKKRGRYAAIEGNDDHEDREQNPPRRRKGVGTNKANGGKSYQEILQLQKKKRDLKENQKRRSFTRN
jgi:ATP-dependent RNA helicase DDX54/DBP10